MKKVILAVLLATAANFSHAQFVTGTKLIGWIDVYNGWQKNGDANRYVNMSEIGSLLGYVSAVADDAEVRFICLPDGVTPAQLVAVIEKYLRENPEKWNHNANFLSAVALMRAFPCQKK